MCQAQVNMRAETLTLGELDNKQNKYKDIAVQRVKCYEGHKEGAMIVTDRDSMDRSKYQWPLGVASLRRSYLYET